jgi:hypothetical protein
MLDTNAIACFSFYPTNILLLLIIIIRDNFRDSKKIGRKLIVVWKSISQLYTALHLAYELPQVSTTVPITSVSYEKSFGVLRRIKNYCLTSMSQTRLKQLKILFTERTSCSHFLYHQNLMKCY